MLIKCPECGKDVSDKAPACIHCGFPLESVKPNMCEINGKTHDLSKVIDIFNGEEIHQGYKKVRIISYLNDDCGLEFEDARRLYFEVEASGKIPSTFTPTCRPRSAITLRCPKCGSTAITTGARGISGFWGAIGASKTVNRCGKCGNTWEPRG